MAAGAAGSATDGDVAVAVDLAARWVHVLVFVCNVILSDSLHNLDLYVGGRYGPALRRTELWVHLWDWLAVNAVIFSWHLVLAARYRVWLGDEGAWAGGVSGGDERGVWTSEGGSGSGRGVGVWLVAAHAVVFAAYAVRLALLPLLRDAPSARGRAMTKALAQENLAAALGLTDQRVAWGVAHGVTDPKEIIRSVSSLATSTTEASSTKGKAFPFVPKAEMAGFQVAIALQLGLLLFAALCVRSLTFAGLWGIYVAGLLCKAAKKPNFLQHGWSYHEFMHATVLVGHALGIVFDLYDLL